MFATFLFRNIARLVLFSYSLQLITPAHAGWIDDPSEAARFRSGLKAKVKAADPFAEVASKKDMPTLTIQTTQGDAGKWDLTVTQTHFDKKTSLFLTDHVWKETYSLNSPSTLINHTWKQYLNLQLSETGELTARTLPQIDQLNPYYGAYNYVFNTAASPHLTLLNLVTGGFVDVQDSAVLTTKHLEAHAGIRLKSQQKISNTSTEGEDKSCILSEGQILLKTPCLDTQRGTIQGEKIFGFLGSKKHHPNFIFSLDISNGAIMADQTQIFNRGAFRNSNGKICGNDLLDFYNKGTMYSCSGQLRSRGNTSIKADALSSGYGTEVSGKNLTIRVNQKLKIDKSSHLIADDKIKLTAGTVQQDSPFSAKTVEVHAKEGLFDFLCKTRYYNCKK